MGEAAVMWQIRAGFLAGLRPGRNELLVPDRPFAMIPMANIFRSTGSRVRFTESTFDEAAQTDSRRLPHSGDRFLAIYDAGMTLSLPPAPNPRWAWFFDIDGTLIELGTEPAPLRVSHNLPELLAALDRRVGGAMALISGRAVSNILALISPLKIPLAGCHGIERHLADGRILRPAPSPGIAHARQLLTSFVNRHDGLRLEDKGVALALHYRQAPHLETACRNAVEQAISSDLGVLAGKMVFEVKPREFSKGTALGAFMALDPFLGRTPVFLGDDLADEDGFEAAATLGGFGILVGPPRPTKAMFRLNDVSSLHLWLTGLSEG